MENKEKIETEVSLKQWTKWNWNGDGRFDSLEKELLNVYRAMGGAIYLDGINACNILVDSFNENKSFHVGEMRRPIYIEIINRIDTWDRVQASKAA